MNLAHEYSYFKTYMNVWYIFCIHIAKWAFVWYLNFIHIIYEMWFNKEYMWCVEHTTNTIDNETLNANSERQMKFQCLCNTPTSTKRNICPKHMFTTMMWLISKLTYFLSIEKSILWVTTILASHASHICDYMKFEPKFSYRYDYNYRIFSWKCRWKMNLCHLEFGCIHQLMIT
jgi:hypothetical protein